MNTIVFTFFCTAKTNLVIYNGTLTTFHLYTPILQKLLHIYISYYLATARVPSLLKIHDIMYVRTNIHKRLDTLTAMLHRNTQNRQYLVACYTYLLPKIIQTYINQAARTDFLDQITKQGDIMYIT